MDAEIKIVMPAGSVGATSADDALSLLMRAIAVKYSTDPDGEWADKYGTNYESDVFMMHQFCWCEEDGCRWCTGCTCEYEDGAGRNHDERTWFVGGKAVTSVEYFEARKEDRGEVTHGERCIYFSGGENEPNFRHKPTGFTLTWYKYIGRDMKWNQEPPLRELLALVSENDFEEVERRGEEAAQTIADIVEFANSAAGREHLARLHACLSSGRWEPESGKAIPE